METQVRRVVPGLRARDYGFIARPAAAAATAAASQGAKENEINTAKRLLKIGFAPVDLLYSESLTKSYQKGCLVPFSMKRSIHEVQKVAYTIAREFFYCIG